MSSIAVDAMNDEPLHDRERELSQLIDMVPCHVWRLTPDGEPTFFNRRMVEYLGLEVAGGSPGGLEALIGSVHPDDAQGFRDTLGRSLATGEPFALRYRLRRGDGAYRWMSSRAEPLRNQAGGIVQWYGVCHDIDDQARAEEALRSREQELKRLVDAVPAMIWCVMPDGEPSYINKRLADAVGVELGDLIEADGSRSLADIHPEDMPAVGKALGHAFETGEPFCMTYRQRRAGGGFRWTEGRAEPLRSETGAIIRWYGVCVDVHDRVVAQEALQEREGRLRQLVDADIIGIVIWDLDGTLIDANDAFLRMVQYDRADVEAGIRWFDMTPPEWQAVHAEEEAEELATTGKMQPREKEYFRKDGSRIPVLIGAACFDGQSRQGVAYILDLTERKRAEAAVREREREFSQLVNIVPGYLWRINADRLPVFFNKRFVDYLGFDVSDLDQPDKSRFAAITDAIIHLDDRADVYAAFERHFATGEHLFMRWRMRRADGVYRWMQASAEATRDENGRIAQLYGLCHDIDDQVVAEAALRHSKQQLEQMIDAVPVNILSFDRARKLTYASRRYLDTVGAPGAIDDFEDLARDVAHPEDFPIMLRRASHGFTTGEPFVNRFRRRCSDGVYRWIEARAQALRDATGEIIQWYIASIDIEEEMQAQAALRERERFLWQLVETLPAMIDCAAPDGEPVYRSQQLREFLGYQLEELSEADGSRLAQTLDAGVHPDDLAAVKKDYAHSLLTGDPYARRHRLRRHDGEYRWIETRAAPMRGADGTIVQWNVICLDIDAEVRAQEDLRLAQERLARASQAASLAELSASIAHEVNQPLAAVVWNSQACQRWLTADPPNLERAQMTVQRIIRDANAAADFVSRIRALFKQAVVPRHRASIGDVIADVGRLLADRTSQTRVGVAADVDAELPEIPFDVVQVQQVLVNLMRNAIEAMDGHTPEPRLGVRAIRDGEVVRVEVSDNGPGVLHPEKVFDAFFTTKQTGMGMGLAICRSIIESHGGRLWVEQNDAGGATFAFTLPIQVFEPS
ncbi:PAS domain-containing protein [Ancylobacter sonchi]|nr:PAS domain-containing protein [Ancylobacter sonchi]MBS7532425.1 PAS domain-containing protein [Ancylobacter sonchi]